MAINICDINNPVWAGIIGGASFWILQSIYKRIRTYIILYKIPGPYKGFEMDGTQHQADKNYCVSYKFLKNIIIIKQKSVSKGNWTGQIPIIDWQPLTGIGSYEYDSGTWGTIQISINVKQKVFTIESTAMSAEKINRYIIKKI